MAVTEKVRQKIRLGDVLVGQKLISSDPNTGGEISFLKDAFL